MANRTGDLDKAWVQGNAPHFYADATLEKVAEQRWVAPLDLLLGSEESEVIPRSTSRIRSLNPASLGWLAVPVTLTPDSTVARDGMRTSTATVDPARRSTGTATRS